MASFSEHVDSGEPSEKRFRDDGHDCYSGSEEELSMERGARKKFKKASAIDLDLSPDLCGEQEDVDDVEEAMLAEKENADGATLEWVMDYLESDTQGEEALCAKTVMDVPEEGLDFCTDEEAKANHLTRGLEEFGLHLLLEESDCDDLEDCATDLQRDTEEGQEEGGGEVDAVDSPFFQDHENCDDVVQVPDVSCFEDEQHLCELDSHTECQNDCQLCSKGDCVATAFDHRDDSNGLRKDEEYSRCLIPEPESAKVRSGLTKLDTNQKYYGRKGLAKASDIYFGYLLEASDDQLGIPPSPSGLSESSSLLQAHQDGSKDISSGATAKLPADLISSEFQTAPIESVLWEDEEGSTGPEGVYDTTLGAREDMASFDGRHLQEASFNDRCGSTYRQENENFSCSGGDIDGVYSEGFMLDSATCLDVDLLELNYGSVMDSETASLRQHVSHAA